MAKTWNPGARRETVRDFLDTWCIRNSGSWSQGDALFGAYEVYCRAYRKNDLTLGEFNDELEQLGFNLEARHGAQSWRGIAIAIMEDTIVRRSAGPRNRGA